MSCLRPFEYFSSESPLHTVAHTHTCEGGFRFHIFPHCNMYGMSFKLLVSCNSPVTTRHESAEVTGLQVKLT